MTPIAAALFKDLTNAVSAISHCVEAMEARAPLTIKLDFGDGVGLSFSEAQATDRGDYVGQFVKQRCLRQINGAFMVDFRPDVDGKRDEIVVEYGTLIDFSVKPPKAPVIPKHLGAYTVTIAGGNLAFPTVIHVPSHWWGARWRWQSTPRPVVRSAAELVSVRAVLPLGSSSAYGPPDKSAISWQGPMGTGGLMTAMGTTGDRADIGPLTEHQASWLVKGGTANEITWRSCAEATGTMGFWVRDAATGALVDLVARPFVAFKDAQTAGYPYQIPRPAAPSATNYFSLDASHMPAAAFVPWLLTDDPYFLEGAQAAAQYGIMENNLARINEKLPTLACTSQPRAFAWSLRDLFSQAAFAPVATPSWLLPRAYWRSLLPDSLTFVKRYISATASPCTKVFGLLTITSYFETFMQDYLTIVLGQAVWNGSFPEWGQALDYAAIPRMAMSDHTGASGWDARFQTPYLVPVQNARLGATAVLPPNKGYTIPFDANTPTSWGELWTCHQAYCAAGKQAGWTDPATWAVDDLHPISPTYLPEARASIAALALAGVPGAAERHNWLRTRMDRQYPVIAGAAYKWAVVAS